MDTGIRGPEEGRLGSSICAVEKIDGTAHDKFTIERFTGFVPADLVADKIKQAYPEKRPELALTFASLVGEGRGKFPFHLSAAQTREAIERVASFVEAPDRTQLLQEMQRASDEAERRETVAHVGSVLRFGEQRRVDFQLGDVSEPPSLADNLSALVAKVGLDDLLDSQVSDYAFLAALDCDASISEIVDRMADAVGDQSEWRLDDLRLAAESGARNRAGRREGAEEAFKEHLAECERSGWPIFEGYEVDPERGSPNPAEYAEEQFEREYEARRAESEDVFSAAEDRLKARPNLSEAEVLCIVRHAARETDPEVMSRSQLGRRLVAACQADAALEFAIDTTIEFVRDDGWRSSDVEIEAIIRVHLGERASAPAGLIPKALASLLPNGETAGLHNEPVERPTSPASRSAELTPAAAREAKMDALTHVPGLVGDLVDWITETNMNPNRTIAFAAALSLVGALSGRLYATTTDLRTNIYTLGLAPSGFGKDHARSCINILVEAAQLGEWMGGSKIQSATGMRRRVEDHPALLYIIDEFGGTMRKMNDVRNVHHAEIKDLFLEYYESSSDVFRGADYAGERGKAVHNPNVCLFGVSNPNIFWEACQSSATVDGFLGRIMPFAVGDAGPVEARPLLKKSNPPLSLINGLRNLTRSRAGGSVNSRLAIGSMPVKPLVVPFGPGAENAFYEAKTHWKQAAFAKRGRPDESIFGRVVENALKVAMIVAIGVDADRPIITVERLQHGLMVAEHCASTTLREIRMRLADNDRQREHVDVKRMIYEAGWEGIGLKTLLRNLNGRITERRLDEILKSLRNGSKEIVALLRPTKGRPANRFVAVENLRPDEAEE